MKRIAARDRGAFETLYYRYAGRLGTYVKRLVKRPELVGEVMNDVMLAVWQGAEQFDTGRPLVPWLYGITRLKALKSLERERRKTGGRVLYHVDEEGLEDAAGASESLDLEREVWRRDLKAVFSRALATLSPEQRAVVELTFYAGLGYQEIAQVMDCPVNTVKTRMFHARRRLSEALRRLGIEDAQDV